MNDFWSTLKSKAGPLPIWAWAGLFTVALALVLMRRKAKSADTSGAAADQTNSDLGSAAQLANMFEVAGLMPYQGGDVYVNTTQTNNPPATPTKPTTLPAPVDTKPPTGSTGTTPPKSNKPIATVKVKHGDTLSSIAKKYGTTWQALYKYNTTTAAKGGAGRPTSTIATLLKRGPNLLYANETILIPPKGYK